MSGLQNRHCSYNNTIILAKSSTINSIKYVYVQYNNIHGHELAMKLEMEFNNLPSLFEAFTLWEVTDPYLLGGMPFC